MESKGWRMWSYSQFSGLLKRKDKSRPLKELWLNFETFKFKCCWFISCCFVHFNALLFSICVKCRTWKGYIVFQMIDYLSWHLLWEFSWLDMYVETWDCVYELFLLNTYIVDFKLFPSSSNESTFFTHFTLNYLYQYHFSLWLEL